MLNLNTLIPAVAAILFVIAIGALFPWISEISGSKTWRGRNGLVDQRRKLILIRRDDVEHLIMVGGPVDMVVETSIRGRPHLEPPLENVIIAKSDLRPAPDFRKS